MRVTEALDSWEIEIALSATCSRCKAPTGQRCVVPESDTPSRIHRGGCGTPTIYGTASRKQRAGTRRDLCLNSSTMAGNRPATGPLPTRYKPNRRRNIQSEKCYNLLTGRLLWATSNTTGSGVVGRNQLGRLQSTTTGCGRACPARTIGKRWLTVSGHLPFIQAGYHYL